MGGWAGWLIPIAVFLLIGVSASVYLNRVRLPRDESAAGVAALAAMRWRDFIHLVLDALIRRGYERVFEALSAGEEGDYVLERDGQRFLLSSKHGAAYILGSTAIAEFANAIRMRGVAGGFLVTPGQFAPEARPLARAQRIELLDGPTLWPELRPLLQADQRSVVSAPSQRRAHRHVLLAWSAAIAIAGLLFVSGRRGDEARGGETNPSTTVIPPVASNRAPVMPVAAPAPIPAMPSLPPSETPVGLQRHREQVAHAISTLPGVDRAVWQTQSTLLVYLQDSEANPLPAICPLLEGYEELAAARLQLQPPLGSTQTVRFVQCRAY